MSAPADRSARAARLVVLYYLATPIFALLDFRGGLDFRVAFLHDHPAARLLYYAVLLALGLLASQRASLAPLVGLLESGANIGMLVVSVMAAYANAVVSAGAVNPFTPAAVVNMLLSGFALALSYFAVRLRGPRGLSYTGPV